MSFVPLHIHSEYSLLQSAGKVTDLINRARSLGYTALALTDRDAMYGVIPFYKECLRQKLKPIVGVELAYAKKGNNVPIQNRLVFIAKNNVGYRSLVRLTSIAHENADRFGPFVTINDVKTNSDGVIAIVPFEEGSVQDLISKGNYQEARNHFKELQMIFGEDVFIEIQNHWRPFEREKLLKISEWIRETDFYVPIVASNHIHFTMKEQEHAHRVIQAIRLGVKLEELPQEQSSSEYYLKSPQEMLELFSSWPEACKETIRIAERCNVTFDFDQIILPKYPVDNDISAKEYLKQLCTKGVYERYETPTEEIWNRLNFELQIIFEMNYEDYFLIVADFMDYSHKNKILTGPGRGSAAGSVVAYVLKITNVDPIKYGLLFERFLNPERVSMPDIDIDFPDDRRDEVIHYVKEKYGKYHVAQIITFGTLAAKAAIRDVGRVLGIEVPLIDKVAKNIPSRPNITLASAIKESQGLREMLQDEQIHELFRIAQDIEGLPRHSSVHAAGIVMSEEPLTDIVPLQHGNDGMFLTQFPMGDIENIGLLKMDFLGLRNLSFIGKICRLIEINHDIQIELDVIPFDDNKTFQLLGLGDTNGVFQLESSGMKSVLRRLKPNQFEDIVAVNALYRPGPMENIPLYIRRKNKEEEVTYPHETLRDILEPTYGVLIYQEQIMQIASRMAGFSLGESDVLRRAVGKKKRDVLEEARQQFVSGAVKNSYSQLEANDMYNLIVRFADYGFNRSHAVAYSVIAYQLAYLKANYSIEFMAAMMESVIHHHEKLGEVVGEARRKGIIVHPPSIKKSDVHFSVKDKEIWIGLAAVKNVSHQAVKEIVSVRKRDGFEDLFDLCAKIPPKILPKRSLEALIVSGVLDDVFPERAQLLASLDMAMEYGERYRMKEEESQTELFMEEVKKPEYITVPPLSERDQLNFEKQVLGFYASGHPVEMDLPVISKYNRSPIQDLKEKSNNDRVRVAGMVEETRVIQTKKKQQMAFVKISDETGELDITVFPDQYESYRLKLQKGELLFIEGKIQEHKGDKKLVLDKCALISSLKQKQAEAQQPKLYVKISFVHEKQGALEELKILLEEDPGEIPVILVYERTNQAKYLSEMWNVSGSDRLLLKLKALLGKKNVILKNGNL
ncbi:DNA polymerase III subunit alpha [Evansella sp. AB-rgal1]|uniref:DNA polymerase III subunit alpha n=1 Tax=Evansella sp. AB-rgal1 TaxID=3242696 RepID=UPI00359E6672